MDQTQDSTIYLTFDEFDGELEQALHAFSHAEAGQPPRSPESSDLTEVKRIVEKGARTGRILDGFRERHEFQKALDYAAKGLGKYVRIGEMRAVLEAFDPAALQGVKIPSPSLTDLDFSREPPAPSADAVKGCLQSLSQKNGVRFDEGLVSELASQLAGDPEAWPLLAFTLRTLAETIDGNKLRRPTGQATVDCRGLLVDVAKQTYQAASEGEKLCLREMLVALGTLAQKSGSGLIEEKELLGMAGRDLKKSLLERLEQRGIVARRGSAFALTHRSLAVRWEALAKWIDERRLRERKIYRWGGIAGALVTVLVLIGGAFMAENYLAIDKANALAGKANVSFAARLGKRAGPQPPADRMDVLRDAVKAYRTKPTVISYTTLFQVVNTIGSEIERQQAPSGGGEPGVTDVLKFQVMLDANGRLDQIVRGDGASMRPETPAGKLTEVVFSPTRRYLALVFSEADKPAAFSVYKWPVGAPVLTDRFRCKMAHVIGSLRISASGRFYTYECPETGPESYIGGITSEGRQKTASEEFQSVYKDDVFAFFNGSEREERYVVSAGFDGVLKGRVLSDMKIRAQYRIPLLVSARPLDAAFGERVDPSRWWWKRVSYRAAVLDRQGIVAVYGGQRMVDRLPFAKGEERPEVYVNTLMQAGIAGGPVVWQALHVGFNELGNCLLIGYAGFRSGASAYEYLFRDETFLIESGELLALAEAMMAGSGPDASLSVKASCLSNSGMPTGSS